MSIPLVLYLGAWLWRNFIHERSTALRTENLMVFRPMDDVLQSVCLHLGHPIEVCLASIAHCATDGQ